MHTNIMGNYFDDFSVGEVINHCYSKTIFESDNNLFCLLTMNPHPVHTDQTYAEKQQHGKILVVGTLVFSLIVGFTVSDISGKAIANLDYEDIKHLKPVFVGDTLRAQTTILDKRLSNSKSDRGIIYVQTIGLNQRDEPVISFKRHILIKREYTNEQK